MVSSCIPWNMGNSCVYPTVRLRARGTDMSPDSFVVGITQHQDDNAEETLVVVVDTAAMFWLADGYMLAIECSTNMRKVPSVLKTLSNLPPAVCRSWSAEDFLGVLVDDGFAHLRDEHAESLCAPRQLNSIDWKESPVARNRSVIAIFRPGSNGRRYLKAHNI